MKKYIMVAITLLALSSCTESKNKEIETHSFNRIIEKGYSIIYGVRVQIIEIDSVEYVVNGSGGIYPLVEK